MAYRDVGVNPTRCQGEANTIGEVGTGANPAGAVCKLEKDFDNQTSRLQQGFRNP